MVGEKHFAIWTRQRMMMKFNRLTILEIYEDSKKRKKAICCCDCGNLTTAELYKITHNLVKSCGCLAKEAGLKQGFKNRKYNKKDKDIYDRWRIIKQRCSPLSPKHTYYFDKGITLCDEWKNNFNAFAEWAYKNGWDKKLTIDRIDNNKGYYPENCRWVDKKTQARNRSTNHLVNYNNKKITIAELADILDISPKTIYTRLYKGKRYDGE